MNTKAKIIIITSVITLTVAGTSFYFLVWRKRKGVTKEDAAVLKGYKVEVQSVQGEDLSEMATI